MDMHYVMLASKLTRGASMCKCLFYLLFDNVPLLARASSKLTPDLLSHGHVLLCKALKLPVIPVVGVTTLGETLMALPAGVGSLGLEVGVLDLVPVEALRPGLQKLLIVLR